MKLSAFYLSLAVGLAMATAATAEQGACGPAGCEQKQICGDPNCCFHCGRHCCCEKYCKLEKGTRDVVKTVWEVKCEEFCPLLPRPSRCCGECGGACEDGKECCETYSRGCADCSSACDPCAVEREKCFIPPKCGHTRCKKTLVKKEVVCKVPAYKCVVVYCCPSCAASGAKEAPTTGTSTAPGTAPAPPASSPFKPEPPPPPAVPPKTADITADVMRLISAAD